MKILALDTSAKVASVAVCDDERPLAIYNIDNGLTQSELILPMVEHILKSLKLSFSDIELFATTVGPGSFTGVRIGTSLIKGMTFGKNIPTVAVSTLHELAENLAPLPALLVPCMDARRNQVYNALFISDGVNVKRLTPDRAISLEDLKQEILEYGDIDVYLSGDGYDVAYKALSNSKIKLKNTPPLLISENAYSCAMIALKKYKQGEYTSDISLLPTYLRLPQAERERLERDKQISEKKDN